MKILSVLYSLVEPILLLMHVRAKWLQFESGSLRPLSMGFSRQEDWSGLPCPPPGDLPDPGIEPMAPALQADALPPEPQGSAEV